jgi:hypothetical protein
MSRFYKNVSCDAPREVKIYDSTKRWKLEENQETGNQDKKVRRREYC